MARRARAQSCGTRAQGERLMRALLLAAGEGRRLRPLTLHRPKPLVTVGGETLIERHLRALVEAGIDEVGINLHYRGEQIEQFVGTGERWGAAVRYFRERELLDTGGAIRNAASWLGSEPFLIVAADVFTDFDFSSLPAVGAADAHLLVVRNPPHNPAGDFALTEQGQLTRASPRDFTYTGVGLIHPRLISAEHRRVFPIRDCMFEAAARGRLAGSELRASWSDVGTVERLRDCREHAIAAGEGGRDQA